MKPVNSSDVQRVGFDAIRGRLRVEFHRGGTYEYLNVPYVVYDGLLKAESKGKYLAQNIKGRYEFVKLTEVTV